MRACNISLFLKPVFSFLAGAIVGYGMGHPGLPGSDAIYDYGMGRSGKANMPSDVNQMPVEMQGKSVSDISTASDRQHINLGVSGALRKSNQPSCESIEEIAIDKVKASIIDMDSPDFYQRRRSLLALSLLGANETQQQVDQVITSEEESPALRRDLIRAKDWQGQPYELTQLIRSTESAEVKAAAIQSAKTTQFDDLEKQAIEEELAQIFISDPDDMTRANVLDYFAYTASEKLNEVVGLLPKDDITPAVKEHIDFLTNPDYRALPLAVP